MSVIVAGSLLFDVLDKFVKIYVYKIVNILQLEMGIFCAYFLELCVIVAVFQLVVRCGVIYTKVTADNKKGVASVRFRNCVVSQSSGEIPKRGVI